MKNIFSDGMNTLSEDLNNVNFDDVILIKIILKLLFMLNVCLDVMNLNNVKNLKKSYSKNKCCSVASKKMVRLVYVRRLEKRNKAIFY